MFNLIVPMMSPNMIIKNTFLILGLTAILQFSARGLLF
uniref:Uncharacterized protein n=1 Tax=Anguilla anguilla TaxID=7936 RepID=A0A0E9PS21_ANGAN